MSPLLVPVVVLSGIGFVMAALLAVGRKAFAVEVDERHEMLMDILPGANCGGCGYPGCSGYASALIEGKAKPTACPPGGADLAQEIGSIMGVEVEDVPDLVALIACAGDEGLAPERAIYLGVNTCDGAHAIAGGSKKCVYGCLGEGTCALACPFDAIVLTRSKLAVVVPELCTGCGQCVAACPRGIIKLVPKSQQVHILCHNPDKAKLVKAVCEVGCTGCKLCNKQSPRFKMNGSLAFVDGETEGEIPADARLVCPQGSIFDSRVNSIMSWTMESEVRETHRKQSEEWKEAEKARKLAKKKAKAEKAAKAKKAREQEEGGSQ